MPTLHAAYLLIDLLYLLCPLPWGLRLVPRSSTYRPLLQMLILTIIQAVIASQVWTPREPARLGEEMLSLLGLVTFGSTIYPVKQLMSLLQSASDSRHFEA